MAIKAKISVDNSELKKGLQEAQNTAQKTGKNIKNSLGNEGVAGLKKLGKGADEAVRALDSIAGATGKASTGLSGLAGDIIGLVTNPVAALIAAFGTLVSIGVSVWNRLSESTAEYRKRLQGVKETLDSNKKAYQDELNFHSELIDRLLELSKIRNKNSNELHEESTIIKYLADKYGDLGLEIDVTTGKYKNLYDAIFKITEINNKNKVRDSELRVNLAQKNTVKSADEIMDFIHGNFTTGQSYDPSKYKTRGAAKNAGAAYKFDTEHNWELIRVIGGQATWEKSKISADESEARTNWNKGTVEGKIKFLEWLQLNADKFNADEDDLENIKNWLKDFKELQAALSENEHLKQIDTNNTKAFFTKLKTLSEQANSFVNEKGNAFTKHEELTKAIDDEYDPPGRRARVRRNDDKLSSVKHELDMKGKQLQENIKQFAELEKTIQKLMKEGEDAYNSNDETKIGTLTTKTLLVYQELDKLKKTQVQTTNDINDLLRSATSTC